MSSHTPDPQPEPRCPDKTDAWILGSGITSLTTAVLLIQEAHIPPSRIHILETLEKAGGGSVSTGDPNNGYDYHAGAMPAFNGICMEKLLSLVPSKSDPRKTALDDLCEYTRSQPPYETPHTRFLSHKSRALSRIDPKRMGMGMRDRLSLYLLSSKTEERLGRSRILDHFHSSFFKSTYWLTLATTYVLRQITNSGNTLTYASNKQFWL